MENIMLDEKKKNIKIVGKYILYIENKTNYGRGPVSLIL